MEVKGVGLDLDLGGIGVEMGPAGRGAVRGGVGEVDGPGLPGVGWVWERVRCWRGMGKVCEVWEVSWLVQQGELGGGGGLSGLGDAAGWVASESEESGGVTDGGEGGGASAYQGSVSWL